MIRFIIILLFFCFFYQGYCQINLEEYTLYWSDEFEGQHLDETKWTIRFPGKRRKAYTTKDCYSVQNGYLALRTEVRNDSIFSTMIGTQKKFETKYGYFEIKCRLQQEQGHWSAFWLQTPLMGKHIGRPDKAGAEIDIFEFFSNKPKHIHHTVHYDGYKEDHKVVHKLVRNKRFNPQIFHTFGLEWTPEYYTFYIDGEAQFTTTEGISRIEQYIILSLEVDINAGILLEETMPDYYIIDYVRVYKPKKPFCE